MLIALLAALSMMATDVIATCEVVAESKARGWMAGWLDVVGWGFSIICTTVSVGTLNGNSSFSHKAIVVLFVSAANLFGTKLGQVVSSRWITEKKGLTSEEVRTLKAVAAAARSGRGG